MKIAHPMHKDGGYYMEDELYKNILPLMMRIKKDKDVVGVFVGSPGEGKSTLAQQVLYPLDNKISVNSIKYSMNDYVNYCLSLYNKGISKGRGVIHDEGKEVLSSLSVTSNRTKRFMNFLYENRQMNMYQFILNGDFFDIPKAIVMQRCLFMIWVHEEGEFDNGYFKFYGREDLKRLYVVGKKYRDMRASRYSFRGTFTKFYAVDEDEYRKVKKAHLTADRYLDAKKGKDLTVKEVVKWIMQRNPDASPIEFARFLNIDRSYVFDIRNELESEDGNVLNTGDDSKVTNPREDDVNIDTNIDIDSYGDDEE